jgi:hypothetical protein
MCILIPLPRPVLAGVRQTITTGHNLWRFRHLLRVIINRVFDGLVWHHGQSFSPILIPLFPPIVIAEVLWTQVMTRKLLTRVVADE